MASVAGRATMDDEVGLARDETLIALFRAEYPRVVRLAFVMTADHGLAEELAQEAFVRTWRSWRRLRDPEAVSTYERPRACRCLWKRGQISMVPVDRFG